MEYIVIILLCFLLQHVASNPLSVYQEQPRQAQTATHPPPNSNHIFNAIHSSMRQWGSSLNHNGMSFFLATVPKGVQFYHGAHSSKPVKGMEWLAFEPEHAMMFAGSRGPPPRNPGEPGKPGRRPPPHRPGEGPPPPDKHGRGPPPPDKFGKEPPPPDSSGKIPPPHDMSGKRLPKYDGFGGRPPPPMAFGHHPDAHEQIPMAGAENDEANMTSGWLHTYKTNKDLRLLYIDGMSAAKSDKGTLDSQDHLLLNGTEPHIGFYDYMRAELMCELAKERWPDRIDGFLRMEAGFEVILCSFEQNLDSVRITRAKDRDHKGEPERGPGGGEDGRFAYYRAIAARYHGIGGGRVVLDYESFVTAYTHQLDLFTCGDDLPRLKNVSADAKTSIMKSLDTLALSDTSAKDSYNWQSIADMIIERYANTLQYLTSGALSSADLLHAEISLLLQPFIDYEFPNTTAEIERCATQFLPFTHNNSLAARVITDISTMICSTLCSALDKEDHETVVGSVLALIEYLDWTTWKDCGGCGYDEICFTAIWPQGSLEDRKNPSCTNASALQEKHGYWGGFGPRD